MIVHNDIIQSAVQYVCTSHTGNKYGINWFSRLLVMNGQKGAGKSYTIDIILTTLVNQYGVDGNSYLKLATTGEVTCLVGEYTVHSHQFGMCIQVGNNKIKLIVV